MHGRPGSARRGGRWRSGGASGDAAPLDGAVSGEGLPGLADRSHRPAGCPPQVASAVEVAVAEMRRAHPRWGAKRIPMELLRKPLSVTAPSVRTIVRILQRQG